MKKFNLTKRYISCLLALTFILILCSAAFAATVTQVAGKAEILKATSKEWEPAKVGDPVNAGDKVRVDGKGQAVVQSEGGKVKVSVENNTAVSYQGNQAGAEKFGLEKGRVWVNVAPGNAVTTESPIQTAAVRGTEYTQSYNPSTGTGSTSVTEGSVEVTDNTTGETTVLGPGDSLSSKGDPTANDEEQSGGSEGGRGSEGSESSQGGAEGGEGRNKSSDLSSHTDPHPEPFGPEPSEPT